MFQFPPRTTVIIVALLLALAALWLVYSRLQKRSTAGTASPSYQTESESSAESRNGHERMVALLELIAQRTPDENGYIGDHGNRQLRAKLAAMRSDTPDRARCITLSNLSSGELRMGNVAGAIELAMEAYDLLLRHKGKVPQHMMDEAHYHIGLAHMRLGETQNCCLLNTADSCIMPFRESAIHQEQEGSRRAVEFFTKVLQANSSGHLGLRARWLLNIAYMTIGGYPDDVPEEYLIPTEVFSSEEEFPRFENIAARLKVDTFNLSGGAIVDDFDNDGYLDIVTSSFDTAEQIRFFRNQQDGTFLDRTQDAGMAGLYGGLNIIQADYNNDGYVDILVLRGAWLGENGQHPNSLLRNNGDGTFTDMTFEAGLGQVHHPTQTAAWADYDNDGDVDLYVGNEHSPPTLTGPSQLFRNNGDGTFTDCAAEAGVENMRFTKGVVWGDYDGDRFPDLYVSNLAEANRLYHNNRDGSFTDVATRLGVDGPLNSFPVWFWDFDNDGILDLYVPIYYGSPPATAAVAASYIGIPFETERACLYRGEGEGRFREVAGQYNLKRLALVMGSNFGDLDNDGYLDFYLGTGYPQYEALMPNVMYHNVSGKRFNDVTWAGGFGQLQKGHAIAFADLDNDGDQDIFQQMGGSYPGDKFFDAVYENPGFGNHWITIQLVGVQSNRSAIGARIRVDVVADGKPRTIYKHLNSGGSFGGNSFRQTIGLGMASTIQRLEVFWPTSNLTQTFQDVAADQFVKITEGEQKLTSFQLRQLKF